LGVLETEIPSLDWIGQMQTLWPNPDLLVLASAGGGWGRYWPMLDMAMPVGGWWPWWGGGGGRLIAFDLTDPGAPKLASDLKIGSDNQGWGFSQAHTAGGLVYLSHQASEFIEGITLPGQTPPQPYEVVKPDGTKEMVTPPVGVWVTKHYLNVVDFTDASSPTVRKAVNLPGQLIGLAQSGALLFTAGPHWDDKWQTDWIEYVDACAYDGVSASLVASLKQSADWPRARAVADGMVFLASKSPAPATSGLIEAWRLGEAGAFTRRGEIALSSPASDLKALGTLLVAQTDRGLQVVDTANPAAMTIVGRGQSAGCTWPDLSLAVGESGSGVWVPLGAYGLLAVPLTAAP
jgi:hypothetical protein